MGTRRKISVFLSFWENKKAKYSKGKERMRLYIQEYVKKYKNI